MPNRDLSSTPIDFDAPFRDRARRILDTLDTHFLEMPRGDSFPDRALFQVGFDAVRKATAEGRNLDPKAFLRAIEEQPMAFVAMRAMLGLTPPEMAALTTVEAEGVGVAVSITQEDARAIDAAARRGETILKPDATGVIASRRHQAVLDMATYMAPVLSRRPESRTQSVNRMDKFDTAEGTKSLRRYLRGATVPYEELLYERILGRPFASHRDSVSGKVGDIIDDAVAERLTTAGVPYYRTRYRERIEGFDQAPDFLIPTRENAKVLIEDKLAEDDGTARDKVARLLRLREVEDRRARAGEEARLVIAVIDGRGFRERTPDLNYALGACDGNIFTIKMLDELVAPEGPLAPFLGLSGEPS